jgi:hypothetical protein
MATKYSLEINIKYISLKKAQVAAGSNWKASINVHRQPSSRDHDTYEFNSIMKYITRRNEYFIKYKKFGALRVSLEELDSKYIKGSLDTHVRGFAKPYTSTFRDKAEKFTEEVLHNSTTDPYFRYALYSYYFGSNINTIKGTFVPLAAYVKVDSKKLAMFLEPYILKGRRYIPLDISKQDGIIDVKLASTQKVRVSALGDVKITEITDAMEDYGKNLLAKEIYEETDLKSLPYSKFVRRYKTTLGDISEFKNSELQYLLFSRSLNTASSQRDIASIVRL